VYRRAVLGPRHEFLGNGWQSRRVHRVGRRPNTRPVCFLAVDRGVIGFDKVPYLYPSAVCTADNTTVRQQSYGRDHSGDIAQFNRRDMRLSWIPY
jgi:hypothetical protein